MGDLYHLVGPNMMTCLDRDEMGMRWLRLEVFANVRRGLDF